MDYIQVSTLVKQRDILSHRKMLVQKQMYIYKQSMNEIKKAVRMFLSIRRSRFWNCLATGVMGKKAQQISKWNI